jgi:hypothetical protein
MKRSRRRFARAFFGINGIALALVTAAAAEERLDVSQIIDKASAEMAIGEPVKATSPRNLDGDDGYYSKCNYYSATSSKTLILRYFRGHISFDAMKQLDSVKASTGSPHRVSGLGDKADIYTGTASGLPANVVMLYVVKGNSLVTIGLSGLDEEMAAEKVKRIAQKIVTQIP